jgi:hypothetical protein
MTHRRSESPWSNPRVIDYVLDSYGGTEEGARGQIRRMFLWEDSSGEVWIGNSAAFAEHCAYRFNFELRPYDYVIINKILIEVGERIKLPEERREGNGKPQKPMPPLKRHTNIRPKKKKRVPQSRIEWLTQPE